MALVETIHSYSDAVRNYPGDLTGQQAHYSGFLPSCSLDLCTQLQDEFSMAELGDLYSFLDILLDGGNQ